MVVATPLRVPVGAVVEASHLRRLVVVVVQVHQQEVQVLRVRLVQLEARVAQEELPALHREWEEQEPFPRERVVVEVVVEPFRLRDHSLGP